MRTRIKICGITSQDAATLSIEAGADALGFVFYEPSPRCISEAKAREIIANVPPWITTVGVFVNATPDYLVHIWDTCRLTSVQLHGDESPDYCREISKLGTAYKAFRIRDQQSLLQLEAFKEVSRGWLLDSYSPGKLGGTGEVFQWDLALQAKHFGNPIILAGGLTPENVEAAISVVRPYGIDVSSGVESSPGVKSRDKVFQFVESAIKGWANCSRGR